MKLHMACLHDQNEVAYSMSTRQNEVVYGMSTRQNEVAHGMSARQNEVAHGMSARQNEVAYGMSTRPKWSCIWHVYTTKMKLHMACLHDKSLH